MDFVAHCLELLAPLGAVRARRMFGGHGIYIDELFIGLVIHEQLYLKVDAQTRPHFEPHDGQAFVYDTKNGQMATNFWSPPSEAFESPALMGPWGRHAVAAAVRAKAVKRKPAARPTAGPSAAGAAPAAPAAAQRPARKR